MKEVLILEDKEETRKMLAYLVKAVEPDASVYEASDEKEAYEIVMKRTIDLFLVDIILHPEEKGDVSSGHFARNIRSVDKYLFTPIIIITSMYDPKMYMYSTVHCYKFIEKPFDMEKVKKTIGEAIRYRTERKKDSPAIFRVDGVLEMAIIGEIVYIESTDHKLTVRTTKEEFEIPYKTCNRVLEELDCDDFTLCKRGIIVNLEYVRKVDPVNRFVHLSDKFGTLEIGPILKKEFMKKVRERGIEVIK